MKEETEKAKRKLIRISDVEFDDFAAKHPLASFHQTAEWGKLKATNGWQYACLALKEDQTILAATLLLSRQIFAGKKVFYAPRGFLIDFDDFPLLQTFVSELKSYIFQQNGILLKVDPYLSYQARDIDGQIVEQGSNNFLAHQNLLKLGFRHHGFSLHQEDLQPRWLFILPTKGQTLDDLRHHFSAKTRQKLNTNAKSCIKSREITREELPQFKAIMASTARRRGFIDRPLSYYQQMYDKFHNQGWVKFVITELDVKGLKSVYQQEIANLESKIAAREQQFTKGKQKMHPEAYASKQAEDQARLTATREKLAKLSTFKKDIEPLGGVVFFTFGHEVLSLFGGAYEDFSDFESAYTTHYWGIQYALEHGFDRYNFYGIEGVFDEKDPMYGIYKFKRGFGGEVVELLGEYDLPIRKGWARLYQAAFGAYHAAKKLKVKLTPKHP